jgi:maltooligosyltrehalose trehalohydrolase
VANLKGEAQVVPLGPDVDTVLLAWDPAATKPADGGLRLPGHGVAVVRLRRGAASTR